MSKMTLEQVRDYHLSEVSRFNRTQNQFPHDSTVLTAFAKHHKDMADAIAAHLTQPAQSVDVRDVVLKSLGGYLERHWPDNHVSYDDMADKLTAELTEKGNNIMLDFT